MVAFVILSALDKEHLFDNWRGPLIALAVAGFVMGVVGHLTQSKTMIATGIALVTAAVIVFPIVLYVRGTP